MLVRRADVKEKTGLAGVKPNEWGLTPGRIATLVKALIRVSEEWGEEAKNFR